MESDRSTTRELGANRPLKRAEELLAEARKLLRLSEAQLRRIREKIDAENFEEADEEGSGDGRDA